MEGDLDVLRGILGSFLALRFALRGVKVRPFPSVISQIGISVSIGLATLFVSFIIHAGESSGAAIAVLVRVMVVYHHGIAQVVFLGFFWATATLTLWSGLRLPVRSNLLIGLVVGLAFCISYVASFKVLIRIIRIAKGWL